eukprot:scaffold19232_cov50-Attheya_sp.AAC.8
MFASYVQKYVASGTSEPTLVGCYAIRALHRCEPASRKCRQAYCTLRSHAYSRVTQPVSPCADRKPRAAKQLKMGIEAKPFRIIKSILSYPIVRVCFISSRRIVPGLLGGEYFVFSSLPPQLHFNSSVMRCQLVIRESAACHAPQITLSRWSSEPRVDMRRYPGSLA